jgi:protein-disulfide isomerase
MQAFQRDKLSYVPFLLVPPLIALIVVVASSDSLVAESEPSFSPTERSAMGRTESLLAGIPQRGAALGDPEAPVTLQFFGDLQCLQSRQVMLGALPYLIRNWVRAGKLRIVYRSKKTDTPDESEFSGQQVAALAAGPQGKMWTYVNLFYREQQAEFSRYADDEFLEGIAEQAGVYLWGWKVDRESGRWVGEIEADEVLAQARDVRSTPAFLIGPTGGPARRLRHFSLQEPQAFDEAIEALL